MKRGLRETVINVAGSCPMKFSGISGSRMSDSENQDGLVFQSRPQNGYNEELQFTLYFRVFFGTK